MVEFRRFPEVVIVQEADHVRRRPTHPRGLLHTGFWGGHQNVCDRTGPRRRERVRKVPHDDHLVGPGLLRGYDRLGKVTSAVVSGDHCGNAGRQTFRAPTEYRTKETSFSAVRQESKGN
jgi:hypothetical protein